MAAGFSRRHRSEGCLPPNLRGGRVHSRPGSVEVPEADGGLLDARKLEDLQKQELIHIEDVAIVSWQEGKRKPKTRHLNNLAGMVLSTAPSGDSSLG